MKLIKQSYEIIPQENSLIGMYRHIEKTARICYKSEDKINDTSYEKMINALKNSKHLAMMEHGTIYLKLNRYAKTFEYKYEKYKINPYSKTKEFGDYYYITTNYRVILENKWEDDLQFICEPTEHHEKRITVKFVTNIGISREFTRHKVFSFAVESTRYCNYSKEKFGEEITYVQPWWISESRIKHYFEYQEQQLSKSNWMVDIEDGDVISTYLEYLENIESYYLYLSNINKLKPEEARGILPLDTKCDMIMTGFVSDWRHFFDLRAIGTTGKPHPQAKELAEPLMEEFKTLNLIV
jgi:thymidylate synthase (FAD)